MYLERAIFVNRAPFDFLDLNLKLKGINILSGINGRGKTTILSHIVDAFHELAKPYFRNSYEGIERKFYRFSSPIFQLTSSKSSLVYLRFEMNGDNIDYVDCRGNLSKDEYEEYIIFDDKIPYDKIHNSLKENNCVKMFSKNLNKEKAIEIFNSNLLTYFPSYRYEQPVYLNDPYKIQIPFNTDSEFSGYLPNPIEVISDLPQLASWIMDVVLDWEVYKNTQTVQLPNGKKQNVDVTPEAKLFNNLNKILSSALSSKAFKGTVRFGISKRNNGGQRISVMHDLNKDKSEQISPNIFCLSSGESSLLCLFGELLRQADKIHPNIPMNQIAGIAIIDEIDKHLHIKLQKEVLPHLFELFPKIQFIVSSHSPFLNMGLAETCLEDTQIIDLDNGAIVSSPTNNKLYVEVYNMMINENNQFAQKYESIRSKLEQFSKPIVITEGKTDIKHILKAKEVLNITDIDFECIDASEQPDGDGNLEKLLEQLSKVRRGNKIIGIFDRDADIVKIIEKDGQEYKRYGNGVYAFCIQPPQQRIANGQTKISIEYLYSDDEIKFKLKNGCRLFFGSEFSRESMFHNSEDLTLKMPKGKGVDKIIENNGGQAVYDRNDNNVLAKKEDFAKAILNDEITISENSWENFKHIFSILKNIINAN